VTVGEEARLKYRYLDLRRPGTRRPGAAIRLRSKVNAAARAVLAGTTSSRSRPRR
jgi:aspartyl-tRNA synthetase